MTDTGGCGNIGISIHALREEGDYGRSPVFWVSRTFLSTPSARRATRYLRWHSDEAQNFYPRPPRGGRRQLAALILPQQTDFYPRPPRGGRHADRDIAKEMLKFLSTPSARRATLGDSETNNDIFNFYPRPPRGGRLLCSCIFKKSFNFYPRPPRGGRREMFTLEEYNKIFLSTPSARRATYNHLNKSSRPLISIHALREEGDRSRSDNRHHPPYFYPRPPRGGRQ